jgi:hypothetical protein
VLELGFTVAIYSTLYDMGADGPTVLDLIRRHASQVEVLCLHLPDRNGNMRGWRHNPEYEANLRAFLALRNEGIVSRFEVMTMDTSGQVHQDLDHIGIELGTWQGHTRAGNVGQAAVGNQEIAATPEHHGAVSCSFTPFYDQNVCLPNGDVVLCCMDYSLQHKIGNLLEQDYYDMFAGPGLARLSAENMMPRFSHDSLCKTCDRAKVHRLGPLKQFWQSA